MGKQEINIYKMGWRVGTTVLLIFGFVRNATFQTPEAIVGVKFLLLIVPSITNTLGLISMYYFPLYGEKLNEMQHKLQEIHSKKSKLITVINKKEKVFISCSREK